ncbi:hypothetical protein BSL82_10040 [Tardibacter chloracetimidivorans]|uniref:Uncharacterized protein n=1 Tax=Tardibacter chloracetimidivorans TaxID=1921510 RepID=A0A1L3ZVF9_9SPHN|nr:hypothetical protein BSL82_10040 [Tardibacter chloracetimidivorans]
MSFRIHKSEDGPSWGEVICDACGRGSPPAAEIIAGHGLNNMGWRCSGGTHFCPDCTPKENDQ